MATRKTTTSTATKTSTTSRTTPRAKKAVEPQVVETTIASTPGAYLAAKLAETGQTEHALAKALGVAPRRIKEIISGERRMTADTSLRLAAYFGGDPMGWMRLQCEAEIAEARGLLVETLATITTYAPVEA
ncbi:HigA family addiction module antitoxin [Paraburkholderia sp. BL10I2N1]|uniref:HigA family addiction module antitoxin n=1 Tax=Paraburkholderia sp. BL10I2N1 TaxID=1938796 RepID=UPI0010F3C8BB|nr:HigA family addiction module antitoxin [Paraburkholderia sp. BL10I2N1]TDN69256.1 addiction module HigA family antidote [Paraburkholderia sp. BL10I2N1]